MADDEHPSEDLFLRFMKGEVAGEERRRVVRHLLRGCGACSEVTRRLWRLTREGPEEDCGDRGDCGEPDGTCRLVDHAER